MIKKRRILLLYSSTTQMMVVWAGSLDKIGVVHVNTHTQITKKHQLMNTIGHELGHGAFGLLHPFDLFPNYTKGVDPGNIMDYQDGDKLRKYQWDKIHQ